MTKTLTLVALVAGSLLVGTTLQAQDAPKDKPAAGAKGGPGQRGRPNIEQVAKQLDLTDAQKPKVQAVLDEQYAKTTELRKDTALSQEDRRAKMKEIRDASNTKLKAILTPEQLTKWEAAQRNRTKPAAGGDTKPKN